MSDRLLSDDFVASQIDAALAPFAEQLTADELVWLRQQLARKLVEDSAARELLLGAHPRNVESSGEQVRLTELLRLVDADAAAGGTRR